MTTPDAPDHTFQAWLEGPAGTAAAILWLQSLDASTILDLYGGTAEAEAAYQADRLQLEQLPMLEQHTYSTTPHPSGPDAIVPRCSCGWEGDPTIWPARALDRWTDHYTRATLDGLVDDIEERHTR